MHDAATAQYFRSSETCFLRAKQRGSNAEEWTRLALKWEKLARIRLEMPGISALAGIQDDEKPNTLRT